MTPPSHRHADEVTVPALFLHGLVVEVAVDFLKNLLIEQFVQVVRVSNRDFYLLVSRREGMDVVECVGLWRLPLATTTRSSFVRCCLSRFDGLGCF